MTRSILCKLMTSRSMYNPRKGKVVRCRAFHWSPSREYRVPGRTSVRARRKMIRFLQRACCRHHRGWWIAQGCNTSRNQPDAFHAWQPARPLAILFFLELSCQPDSLSQNAASHLGMCRWYCSIRLRARRLAPPSVRPPCVGGPDSLDAGPGDCGLCSIAHATMPRALILAHSDAGTHPMNGTSVVAEQLRTCKGWCHSVYV